MVTGDYRADATFTHGEATDRFVSETRIRSLVVAPMLAGPEVFGALGTFSAEPDAFAAPQIGLVRALADHAALAMANARLFEELARSHEAIERQAAVERSLRELGTRISGAHDPASVVQHTMDEARRLLHGDGARIDIVDPAFRQLRGLAAVGQEPIPESEWPPDPDDRLEVGASGLAVVTGRTVISPDYLADPRLVHGTGPDTFVRARGIHGVIATPLFGDDGPFGAITVWSMRVDAFGAEEATLLETIAGQSAVALGRARLIEELRQSREALTRQADEERSLREIARRMMSSRDPSELLRDVVNEAARLLGSSGAVIDLVDPASGEVRWAHDAGIEPETRVRWRQHAAGMDGVLTAIRTRSVVLADDYAADGRFPDGATNAAFLEHAGIRSMAIAPLVGDTTVLGTLAAFAPETGRFDEAQGDLLAALADLATIALSNADLLARVEASEARYRGLVQSSPDLIFEMDGTGVYTFYSDRTKEVIGWRPDELIGHPFSDFIDMASFPQAGERIAEIAANPGRPSTDRLMIHHRDGHRIPFEVSVVGQVDEGGRLTAIRGVARDIRERERLETELRGSEERYRYLVQSSPDLVWMTDEDGRLTFVSDQVQAILGWPPAELIGRSFADLAPQAARRGALARFRHLSRRPTEAHRTRLGLLARDGRELAMEITGIGMVASGRFIGAHGAARDVSERERLERGLLRQAAELASSEERAHLARELHDSVTQALFSMTLHTRSIELLLDRDPARVPEQLVALRELQRDALAEMRALIFELRPGNVEEVGLVAALRTHSASLAGRIGLPVVVEADLAERPSLEIEETLYRIAQEALHNVVKHAGARAVRVEAGRRGDWVWLRVVDDGRGFDPLAVPDGHLGLAGMRSRAERLGGRLTVTATPGHGTVIEVRVPEPPRDGATSDDAAPGNG